MIGTHGRSVWVLDVSPIEELTDGIRASDVHVFDIRPVALKYDPWQGAPGDRHRRARARFSYYLKTAQPVTVTVRDDGNHVVRTFQAQGEAGINTGVWDLQVEGGRGGAGLREASVGRYRIEVGAGGGRDAATLDVESPPELAGRERTRGSR